MSKVINVTEEAIAEFLEIMEEDYTEIFAEDVDCTSTTLDEFRAQWGKEHDADGDMNIWNNLQVAKGKMRGDLYVIEVEGGSISYFGGEK